MRDLVPHRTQQEFKQSFLGYKRDPQTSSECTEYDHGFHHFLQERASGILENQNQNDNQNNQPNWNIQVHFFSSSRRN
jgi:hypothetical protein